MLTLVELRRVRDVLNASFRDHVIERWMQPDGERVTACLYGRDADGGEGRKRFLLACGGPEQARVSELAGLPRAPDQPPGFVSYLRAHLSRARFVAARLIGDDRILALRFTAKEGEFDLVVSILGKRSNLYVLDAKGVIVAALRRAEETRAEMTPGAKFAPPGSGVPRDGEDRFAETTDDALLVAIEAVYAEREEEQGNSALVRDLRQSLKRERKNAERRLEKLEQELAEADEANTLQRHGELLKGSLGRISPGDSEIRVRDYETGEEVTIPLDPKIGAKANLEATFKRYQKMLRRLTKAGGQVEEARAWWATLNALAERVEAAAPAGGEIDEQALAELALHPEVVRLLGRRRTARSSPQAAAEAERAEQAALPARLRGVEKRLQPRRYQSLDGLEIWVGRNDAGNDYLSTRLARGSDLFFHLDGAPGSHVILRTEGRTDPPSESLLDACELAVHFSKQKNATRADVHIVPIKNVKKPKGAKPGLVYVTGGRSLHLRREETRLARLFASRLDQP